MARDQRKEEREREEGGEGRLEEGKEGGRRQREGV